MPPSPRGLASGFRRISSFVKPPVTSPAVGLLRLLSVTSPGAVTSPAQLLPGEIVEALLEPAGV